MNPYVHFKEHVSLGVRRDLHTCTQLQNVVSTTMRDKFISSFEYFATVKKTAALLFRNISEADLHMFLSHLELQTKHKVASVDMFGNNWSPVIKSLATKNGIN